MTHRFYVYAVVTLLGGMPVLAEASQRTLVVTASNTVPNRLQVYNAAGALVQTVPTQGDGGVGGNAGGVAADGDRVAVVNFASQTVSILDWTGSGFAVTQVVPALSSPVSVAFARDHLYILGTTMVESHRIARGEIDLAADGAAGLVRADGSAAQVGVAASELIVTEKSGVVEVIALHGGVVAGPAFPVLLPADAQDTPLGLVTRGSNSYVTIAHSDLVALVKKGALTALVATGSGFPDGPGQQAPCWITIAGPYLFTANTPSHSVSRLVATGRNLVLDLPVAAQTVGAPTDIASDGRTLALIEGDSPGQSHLTQYDVDGDGTLTRTAYTAVGAAANGVAIVSVK